MITATSYIATPPSVSPLVLEQREGDRIADGAMNKSNPMELAEPLWRRLEKST
jgi:hypothetical protein